MPIDGALGLAQPLLAGTRGRNPPGMGEKGKKGSVPLAAPLPGLSAKGWLCLIALGTAAGAGLGPGRDESRGDAQSRYPARAAALKGSRSRGCVTPQRRLSKAQTKRNCDPRAPSRAWALPGAPQPSSAGIISWEQPLHAGAR